MSTTDTLAAVIHELRADALRLQRRLDMALDALAELAPPPDDPGPRLPLPEPQPRMH